MLPNVVECVQNQDQIVPHFETRLYGEFFSPYDFRSESFSGDFAIFLQLASNNLLKVSQNQFLRRENDIWKRPA